jgi:hypothetical protein
MRKLVLTVLAVSASQAVLAGDTEVKTAPLVSESRKVSTQLIEQIGGELKGELERTGPLRAIIVCKYSAPEATSALSRRIGYRVTRVALRARNKAIGEPDAFEQKVLLDFEKRVAQGEKAETLEHSEVVSEPSGRHFRYMKAIPMASICATCHGANLSNGIKAQLGAEYPYDTATNYRIGEIRGAVSVKRPI